jgi:hypothetical protein
MHWARQRRPRPKMVGPGLAQFENKKNFWADVRVILKYPVSSKCCKNTKKKVRKTKWVCFLCIWPNLKKNHIVFSYNKNF